ALVTLASEGGAPRATVTGAVERVEAARNLTPYTSTQENAWMVLAARALAKDAQTILLDVGGQKAQGVLNRNLPPSDLQQPLTLTNAGENTVQAVVTVSGAPVVPEPATEKGFVIERKYYTLQPRPKRSRSSDASARPLWAHCHGYDRGDRGEMSSSANPRGETLSPLRGGSPRWRRSLWLSLVAASTAIVAVGLAATYWIASLGPAPLGQGLAFSAAVVDREGKLLRPYTTPEGRWRLPATRADVDSRFVSLLLAYEDKRFSAHHGIDLLALGRAFAQLVTHGHIVSGASTITMQVARLLEPRAERSFKAKLRQIVRAVEIERALSKDEILALYLSLAPYGGNLEGIRAASLAYFGKEPRRLTLGEAAMLVALPQSPERRRPDRSTAAVRAARDRVLER